MAASTRRQVLWAALGALALAGGGLAFSGGFGGAAGASYQTRFMSVDEMRADGALVVDIRTAQEWQEGGVIEGAKLVTFMDAQSFLAEIGGDLAEGQDLVLVCRSGRRSGAAAEALAGLIPNRIISLDGGMNAVIGAGYRAVAPAL